MDWTGLLTEMLMAFMQESRSERRGHLTNRGLFIDSADFGKSRETQKNACNVTVLHGVTEWRVALLAQKYTEKPTKSEHFSSTLCVHFSQVFAVSRGAY